MLFGRSTLCGMERPPVEHLPVVLGPLGRTFAVARATAWSAILRAPGSTQPIPTHAATPAAVLITCDLLGMCHVGPL